MQRVSKDTFIYAMSAKNKPAAHVEPGTQVLFETWDALHGQLQTADAGFESLDWDCVNPATGPIYINGAEPGDVLSVKIESIEVSGAGIVLCGAGMGVMGHALQGHCTKIVPIKDGLVHFSDAIKLPLNKMIGVIGTAPKSGEIPCGVPDLHGGNMDCKEIREGATVLLPVNVPGALLAIGDLHAVMGDGEIGVTGVEVAGSVTVTVDIFKGKALQLPMIRNDSHVMTLASDEDLDKAVDMSVANMISFLTESEGFSPEDAVMLTSLVADVRICQVVDPKKTVRVEFPREHLRSE
ncbi:MAG: acetamidase/formamidase family protein [Oscillospiraceae bacterium]|nr:acetamidase/formamidase family protein [Oscillospiraceae bacterium]